MNQTFKLVLLIFVYNTSSGNPAFTDYFTSVTSYFSYSTEKQNYKEDEGYLAQTVPYEVSISDEKFITEAAKLTGVALSQLDSCQHRVVLKLQTTCHKMNDEQLAKMAVMLLNCQSAVEGRRIYPCTDEMSIKDCTMSMDADTWNSYHLISNRARAVCYSVRQTQFRGLTEHTINRLLDSAKSQQTSLGKIAKDQEELHNVAQDTLDTVTQGQARLAERQRDLLKAQLHGQFAIEDNIRRLSDEKRLIAESHVQLAEMTQAVQDKLERAATQLQRNTEESHVNHQELIEDLNAMQEKAQMVFQSIEDWSTTLMKQAEGTRLQYELTYAQLVEMNATVHSLVSLVGGTRKALEERLAWINTALGGTDQAIERLYAILWHAAFLFIAMVSCAFLAARTSTRLAVACIPPLNLLATLKEYEHALDPVSLATALGAFVLFQTMFFSVMGIWRSQVPQKALPWIKEKLTPLKTTPKQTTNLNTSSNSATDSTYFPSPTSLIHNGISSTYDDSTSSHLRQRYNETRDEDIDGFDEYRSPTPPPSRNGRFTPKSRSTTPSILNGLSRNACCARTRMGTPCKLTSLPGREFCYRHQTGDSVIVK